MKLPLVKPSPVAFPFARTQALGLVLVAAACSSSPSSPSGSVPLGQPFTLKPGETAVMDSGGPRVTFQQVDSDTRCPADVVCVQAGDATVALAVDATPVRLLSNAAPEKTAGGFRIRLDRVDPSVYTSRVIKPGDYRVVLRVNRD